MLFCFEEAKAGGGGGGGGAGAGMCSRYFTFSERLVTRSQRSSSRFGAPAVGKNSGEALRAVTLVFRLIRAVKHSLVVVQAMVWQLICSLRPLK